MKQNRQRWKRTGDYREEPTGNIGNKKKCDCWNENPTEKMKSTLVLTDKRINGLEYNTKELNQNLAKRNDELLKYKIHFKRNES